MWFSKTHFSKCSYLPPCSSRVITLVRYYQLLVQTFWLGSTCFQDTNPWDVFAEIFTKPLRYAAQYWFKWFMHSWIFFERPVPRDFTVYCGENYMRIKHQMGQKIPFLHSPHSQIMTPRYTGKKKFQKFQKISKIFQKNF